MNSVRLGSQVLVLVFLTTVPCTAQSPSPGSAKPRANTSSIVSVQELSLPAKARRELEAGANLLAKGEAQASIEHFLRAIEQSPRYFRLYHNLGLAYYRLGQFDDASRNFQKSIDLSNSTFAPSLFGLAMILYRDKEYSQAEPLITRALVLEPSATGKYCLGSIQLALGRTAEAERSAREAIQLDPALGDPHFLLARIHETQSNPSATIEDVRRYFQLTPNSNRKPEALALLYRAHQAIHSPTRDAASLH